MGTSLGEGFNGKGNRRRGDIRGYAFLGSRERGGQWEVSGKYSSYYRKSFEKS